MSKVTEEQYIKDLEHDIDMLATMVLDLRMENAELKDRLVELGECDDIVENRGEKFSVSEILGKKVDENQLNLFEDK